MAHHDSIEYPKVQQDNNEYSFTEDELALIQSHIAKYPDKTSAVMPALWIAQEKYGWLSNKLIQLVADTLGISFAHVYGVATFYTMYLKENMGKHLVEVCTCFSCGICGGEELYSNTKKYLKTNEEGVSPDKLFYVREAECLGACDSAPVVQINNRRMRFNVDDVMMREILEALKNNEELPYTQVPMTPQ